MPSRVNPRGMSLSRHLCLLTIVGLILPIRDAVQPELQPTPQTPALQADVETPVTLIETQTQRPTTTSVETPVTPTETQTQRPMTVDVPRTPELVTDKSSTEGIMPSKQPPGNHVTMDPAFKLTGSQADDPFSYDEASLRKRGLLVAAVLFITGIVILTSGKCRQLSRVCRNYNRAYKPNLRGRTQTEPEPGQTA